MITRDQQKKGGGVQRANAPIPHPARRACSQKLTNQNSLHDDQSQGTWLTRFALAGNFESFSLFYAQRSPFTVGKAYKILKANYRNFKEMRRNSDFIN